MRGAVICNNVTFYFSPSDLIVVQLTFLIRGSHIHVSVTNYSNEPACLQRQPSAVNLVS